MGVKEIIISEKEGRIVKKWHWVDRLLFFVLIL
jgi:hypothetical protein